MPYLIGPTFFLYRPSGTKPVTWSIDKSMRSVKQSTVSYRRYGAEHLTLKLGSKAPCSGLGLVALCSMRAYSSGHSQNVSNATAHAKPNSTSTIGLLGRDGGVLGTEVDVPLIVPSSRTAMDKGDAHPYLHLWCEMLDAA